MFTAASRPRACLFLLTLHCFPYLFVYQLRAHPASVEAVAGAGGAASAEVQYTVVSTSAVATADVC
ncbi:hypothetical protein PF005_g8786 [Phytophthora fragariae]|uniref:Secreted protein n=1 Tax=Phytophthora fragariae TaxID=53985 RepID=A0A6A3F9C7_9STRA|nr:hypothetical protein PF003_g12116 [Phytophthora fragariae]KAE8940420.1 hypothetical protein PF009_g9764 [Phytophthora fragariae]KAE9013176.1 hypothetical protein PF011_g8587 [Phytophthora fragariae]KAE9103054.1 hypothetical protein PF007_g14531 [Phytophthora fragariae]KAE9118711.1 hypothetical protein PF010_g8108 [Phytophthora fragariae]